MTPTYVLVRPDGSAQVWDIKEPEAFVRAMLVKTKLKIQDADEREDIIAEGLAIMLDLASKFRPRMAGYERDGSFAGYCSRYLAPKIWAAWHGMHPEHLMQTQADGKKRYVYGEAPASLDEKIEGGLDEQPGRLRTVGDFVFTRPAGKSVPTGAAPSAV